MEFKDVAGLKIAGQAVDLAARVMSLGKGGYTLVTRHAFDSSRQHLARNPVDPAVPLAWVAHGRYRFKGNDDDPLEIFGVRRGFVHTRSTTGLGERQSRVGGFQ